MSSIITDTIPTNLLIEKEKFFNDDTYNPQFTYKRAINPEELRVWGVPKTELFEHSERMLNRHGHATSSDSEIISMEYIEKTIADFNKKHNLEKPIALEFSEHFPSRCRVGISKIYFRLPIQYTISRFSDLMRHELETHMLRRLNNNLQPWGETEFPDQLFRKTEEGLAGLHTHLYRSDKLVRKSFLNYIAVYLAQQTSFRTIFTYMRDRGVSPETAWLISVRSKRGIEDTSQHGGLTKDLCYLEGMIEVYNWLSNPSNSPYDLYLGRIGLEQISILKPIAVIQNLKYPTFFSDLDAYLTLIQEIGSINEFMQSRK